MRNELRNKIAEENKYYKLLESNKQYRLQGSNSGKVIVGVIQGNPNNYKEYRDFLEFKHFDSWKEAFEQLSN